MELDHAQQFVIENAPGGKRQTDKIAFEIRGHASTWSNALSLPIQLFCFYFSFFVSISPFDVF